jgi:hypothetical protein
MIGVGAALAFGEAGFPIIPVRLSHDGERWRKLPMTTWDQATSNEVTIEWWWRKWPDALPGIPLARMNWAVVDADRREGVDGVAQVTDLGPLGPHSRIATPSGGLHLVFAQPPKPITGRFKWCEGVEVLGEGCLLTCYDLEELKFPHVAPRAVLPEMFWRPRDGAAQKVPKDKAKGLLFPARAASDVAGLLEALRAMDPCDWRGEHDAWRDLMNACKAEGIACEDFVSWSVGDPHYAHDGQSIRREWKSLRAQHGGALWAALKARGIKVQTGAKRPSLYPRVPSGKAQSQTGSTRGAVDWRLRFNGIRDWLKHNRTEGDLFSASCLVAEIMAQHQRPKPSTAMDLLERDAKDNGLLKAIGPDRVRRTIANGLRHVEEKVLAGTEN